MLIICEVLCETSDDHNMDKKVNQGKVKISIDQVREFAGAVVGFLAIVGS